jgi:hypothetical protein
MKSELEARIKAVHPEAKVEPWKDHNGRTYTSPVFKANKTTTMDLGRITFHELQEDSELESYIRSLTGVDFLIPEQSDGRLCFGTTHAKDPRTAQEHICVHGGPSTGKKSNQPLGEVTNPSTNYMTKDPKPMSHSDLASHCLWIQGETRLTASKVNALRKSDFSNEPGADRGEIIANLTLAYRHLEDAAQRLYRARVELEWSERVELERSEPVA